MKLKVSRIIDYYEFPQLFIAINAVFTKYLCMLISVNDENLKYIAIQISSNRLYDLESNKIDLKNVYEYPEINEYFSFSLSKYSEESFEIDNFLGRIEEYLPEEGLFVGTESSIENIKNIAIEKNKNVYMLHLIEQGRRQSVSANLVASFLLLTQKIVKNSFTQGAKKITKEVKSRIKESNSSVIEIFALSTGSLNVLFSTNSYVDMFGYSDDEIYLNKIKELFLIDYHDIECIKSTFKSNRGHLISAVEQLCKKVIDSGTDFELNYATPSKNGEGVIHLDQERAKIYYDFINTAKELEEELVEFIAVFVQADVERGNWRVKVSEENEEISGKSSGGLLSGVVLETELYTIECREVIKEDPISGEENKQYDLIKYNPIKQ